jgi:hypothetical protein
MSDVSNKQPPLPPSGSTSGAGAGRQMNQPGSAGQQTQDLAQQAKTAARDIKNETADLADAAVREVSSGAAELADKAKQAAADASGKLLSAVEDQKRAGVQQVNRVAHAVRTAANELDHELPEAARYVRRAAEQIESVSNALQNRNINQLINEVQNFARRNPTAFLGATVVAGFALVRFLKSASGSQDQTATHSSDQFGGTAFGTAAAQPSSTTGQFSSGGPQRPSQTPGYTPGDPGYKPGGV